MKKSYLKKIAIICMPLLLTACGSKVNEAEPTPSAEPTVTEAVAPTEAVTPTPTPEEPDNTINLDNYTPAAGYDNLYEVMSFNDTNINYFSISSYGDNLLIVGEKYADATDDETEAGASVSNAANSEKLNSEEYSSDMAGEDLYDTVAGESDEDLSDEVSDEDYYDQDDEYYYGEYEMFSYCFTLVNAARAETIKFLDGDDYGGIKYMIAGDNLLLFDDDNGLLYVFDENLDNTGTYKMPENSESYAYYVGDEPFPLYAYDYMDETLYKLTKSEGEELNSEELEMSFYSPAIASVCSDDSIILSAIDKETLRLEIVKWDTISNGITYSCDQVPSSGYIAAGTEGRILFEVDTTNSIWACQTMDDNQTESKYYVLENSWPVITSDDKLVVSAYTYEDDYSYETLSLYNLDGSSAGSFEFRNQTVNADGDEDYRYLTSDPVPTANEDYYFLAAQSDEDGFILYIWDASSDIDEDKVLLCTDYETGLDALVDAATDEKLAELSEAYDEADEFSEKYGASLYIGNQIPASIDTYCLEQELDAEEVEAAIELLDKYFSNYPDNFFEQLKYGSVTDFNIYLCGTISSDLEGSLDSADAFVNNAGNTISLVLDINASYNWAYTVNHELSHIIDARLSFESMYDTGSLFSEVEWCSLNPDGFEYPYDYEKYYDVDFSDLYINNYIDAFIDSYGMTFPTEDRAMIFGKACEIEVDDFSWPVWEEINNGSYIQQKYQYYCECIRAGFDTTGWPEVTFWERGMPAG